MGTAKGPNVFNHNLTPQGLGVADGRLPFSRSSLRLRPRGLLLWAGRMVGHREVKTKKARGIGMAEESEKVGEQKWWKVCVLAVAVGYGDSEGGWASVSTSTQYLRKSWPLRLPLY